MGESGVQGKGVKSGKDMAADAAMHPLLVPTIQPEPALVHQRRAGSFRNHERRRAAALVAAVASAMALCFDDNGEGYRKKPDFKPNFQNYMTYQGSFTTPPCTEGVQWILLRNPVYIFEEDYVDLHELLGDNYRPVQPLNGRVVSTLV